MSTTIGCEVVGTAHPTSAKFRQSNRGHGEEHQRFARYEATTLSLRSLPVKCARSWTRDPLTLKSDRADYADRLPKRDAERQQRTRALLVLHVVRQHVACFVSNQIDCSMRNRSALTNDFGTTFFCRGLKQRKLLRGKGSASELRDGGGLTDCKGRVRVARSLLTVSFVLPHQTPPRLASRSHVCSAK